MRLDPKNITLEGWVAILGVFVAGASAAIAVKSDIVGLQHDVNNIRLTQLATSAKVDQLYNIALSRGNTAQAQLP